MQQSHFQFIIDEVHNQWDLTTNAKENLEQKSIDNLGDPEHRITR